MVPPSRASILAEAREWIGTPYHHKGRVKRVGVDCGGLLYCVYGKFFNLKPFPTDYPADWACHNADDGRYLDFIAEYVTPSKVPTPGGVAVFRWGVAYSHGAICTERATFIHAFGRTAFGTVKEDSIRAFHGVPVKYFDLKVPLL
jgi:NlpC/P60 family putative phage cell wall peptidase